MQSPCPDRTLTVIFTAALPGHGKTTLINKLAVRFENDPCFKLEVVASDAARQDAKDYYRTHHDCSSMTEYQIEELASVMTINLLKQHIIEAFERLRTNAGNNIFMLDKNYVSDDLRDFILIEAKKVDPTALILILLPRQTDDKDLKITLKGNSCPFAFDSLFASLVRCYRRKSHPTMKFGNQHVYKSIINCLYRFSGIDYLDVANAKHMKLITYDYFNQSSIDSEEDLPKLKVLFKKVWEIVGDGDIKEGDGDRVEALVESEHEIAEQVCRFIPEEKEIEFNRMFEELMGHIKKIHFDA